VNSLLQQCGSTYLLTCEDYGMVLGQTIQFDGMR
jgi:hypothetical protein